MSIQKCIYYTKLVYTGMSLIWQTNSWQTDSGEHVYRANESRYQIVPAQLLLINIR